MAARPDKIITLADEASAAGWVEDREFDRAIILGPAVILPAEKVGFIRTALSGIPESLFIEIPEGKPVQGVIGLRNVTFTDCRFQDIAIIGTPDAIREFREGLEPGASAEFSVPPVPPPPVVLASPESSDE